jgi:hypothetical protein
MSSLGLQGAEYGQEQLLETTRNRGDINIFFHGVGHAAACNAETQRWDTQAEREIRIRARGGEGGWS